MTAERDLDVAELGPNMWLIDEMHRRFQEDPDSVDPGWKDFFEGFTPGVATAPVLAAEAGAAAPRGHASPYPTLRSGPGPGADPGIEAGAEPLTGAAARIAENMEASLAIPTATSVRTVPARLLEENRRVINRFLDARGGGKVSFTHLIGWGIVRALQAVPAMTRTFVRREDGKPGVATPERINLGLAVDVTRRDGSHSLLVPNVRSANHLSFAGFWEAYEEVIRKVRTNRLSPDDFAGITVTITNPGTVGTQLSVPRLMPGQGVIVGVGRIGYPAGYEGADPSTLAALGVGKVIGLTSTYDHRVIQGAES